VTPTLLEDIPRWTPRPHFASVNFGSSEDPWQALLDVLGSQNVQIEAGAEDEGMVDALARSGAPANHLVLLIVGSDESRRAAARRYVALSDHARGAGRWPIVAHGFGDATWGVVGGAMAAGDHVRVGFEDVSRDPSGRSVSSNAELVEAAVRLAHSLGRRPLEPSEVASLGRPMRGRAGV
jgi:uncharacterized protein (DUF849 family)